MFQESLIKYTMAKYLIKFLIINNLIILVINTSELMVFLILNKNGIIINRQIILI